MPKHSRCSEWSSSLANYGYVKNKFEVGLHCCLWLYQKPQSHPRAHMWIILWLFLVLTVASGYSKLTSELQKPLSHPRACMYKRALPHPWLCLVLSVAPGYSKLTSSLQTPLSHPRACTCNVCCPIHGYAWF